MWPVLTTLSRKQGVRIRQCIKTPCYEVKGAKGVACLDDPLDELGGPNKIMHEDTVRPAPDDPVEGPNRPGRKAHDEDDFKDWPWGSMVCTILCERDASDTFHVVVSSAFVYDVWKSREKMCCLCIICLMHVIDNHI